MKKIWYENPARCWDEALPVGNGRIGAMVYGGSLCDRIQINEETLWSGYPGKFVDYHNMSAITEVRKLIADGEYKNAEKKLSDMMPGFVSEAYVPYGSLYMDIIPANLDITAYKRELDLENGICKTYFTIGDNEMEKTVFSSLSDDVLVIHYKTTKGILMSVNQAVDLEHSISSDCDTITVTGRCPTSINGEEDGNQNYIVEYKKDKESIQFCSKTKIISDGPIYGGVPLYTHNTLEVTIIFSIATSFNGYNKMPVSEGKDYIGICEEKLNKACEFSFEELLERHCTEYHKYFDRVSIKIEGENFDHIPTDKRIKDAGEGKVDNGLVTLLFDYARYLTISGAGGTQPMNLQGIWNYRIIPPWRCNYTMNINTQMNYWHIEVCNLPEFHIPLINMLRDLKEKGNKFGLRGWASWHNSDIWRFSHEATKGVLWGFWQMGGAWTAIHIWEHYIYTQDANFLADNYDIMEEAAIFMIDWMYENKDGYLTTAPSTSPENQFKYKGEVCSVCEGCAMDMQIIYDLFDKVIKAGEILGKDITEYKDVLSRLKPVFVGDNGRILEWGQPFEENDPGHRHISFLYGFFPSDILDDWNEPIRKSLEYRLEHGGGHTGWSNAWIACAYARLHDGENVMRCIRNMFSRSIYPNMLDRHPPFQIDGNFGICRAICEVLLQAYNNPDKAKDIVPNEWMHGEVLGLVNKNGEIINYNW